VTESDRLRVQLSTNLSIALVAAAFTMLAGVVAAFVTLADKIPVSYGWYGWLIGGAAFAASLCLIMSITFGGAGISKVSKAIQQHKEGQLFPEHYAGGNFNRQAYTGLAGSFIGVLAFIFLGIASQRIAAPTPETLSSDLQKTKEEVRRLWDEISRIKNEQAKSAMEPEKSLSEPLPEKGP
jgi:hypothetical protein